MILILEQMVLPRDKPRHSRDNSLPIQRLLPNLLMLEEMVLQELRRHQRDQERSGTTITQN
jgi:hypothetical protein